MNLKAGRLELLQSFMHLSALSIMHCNGKIVNCPEHLQNYMKEFQCIRQNHNALQSSSNNRPLYCISLHFLISPMKIWVEYLQCNPQSFENMIVGYNDEDWKIWVVLKTFLRSKSLWYLMVVKKGGYSVLKVQLKHKRLSHHSCHVSITWFELSSLPEVSGSEYLCVDCVLTIHC